MIRWRKCVVSSLLGFVVMLLIAWTTLTHWLPWLAHYWLPTGIILSISQPSWHKDQLQLPKFTLNVRECKLVDLSGITIAYPQAKKMRKHYWMIHIKDASFDKACLTNLPTNTHKNQKPFAIHKVLSAIPAITLTIDRLALASWQEIVGKLAIDTTNKQQLFNYQSKNLTLSGKIIDYHELILKQFLISLPEQSINLQGKLILPENTHQFPEKGQFTADVAIQHYANPLIMTINWQDKKGYLILKDKTKRYSFIELPWYYNNQQMEIKHGHWQWLDKEKQYTGNIDLTVEQWEKSLDTTRFTGRINLLTQGKRGKGNLVLSVNPSEIHLFKTGIPFQLTGNINIADMIISLSLPMRISGPLMSPKIRFQSGSLVRAVGKITDKLAIKEIRLPLAGSYLTLRGFSGRLQSIVSIADDYWGICKIYFDGNADNFIPDRGNWQWHYWGRGYLSPFDATWDIAGKGGWHNSLIHLDSQSIDFNQIKYGIMTMLSPRLQLTQPLYWQRNNMIANFMGDVLLTTQQTWFRQHGYFPPTSANIVLRGTNPQHFIIKGQIKTKQSQPIIFYSRWDGKRLRGQARWPQQPLNIIQTVIPSTAQIKIRNGTFYAQAAFSAAIGQGFIAGGHWLVKDGAAWLKKGDIKGVDFILPWRLNESLWHLGINQPVQLRIKQLNNLFTMNAISADLQGFYPPTLKKPLILSNMKMNLLGGWIGIDQLAFPQKDASPLFLHKFELSYLLQALKVKQLALSGKINGELPLYLNKKEGIIQHGWLENNSYLTLRLDKDTADSIAKDNLSAGIAINWLRYLEIKRSRTSVNLDKQGQLLLNAQIYGVNPLIDKRREVRLHLNYQENIFQLWRSLQFGSTLEARLQQYYETRNQE